MTAEEFLSLTVSQTTLGKILGLTQGRISQLLTEGILVRDAESQQPRLHDSIKNYYLSKNATGAGVNYWSEKALHEKAKRELAELKVEQRKGNLYDAAEVESELTEWITEFRNKLLAIGHKLCRRLEGKNAAQICEIIDAEIYDCLTELSQNIEDGKEQFANSSAAIDD